MAQDAKPQKQQFFTAEVLPLLKAHCFECHSHEYGESSGQLMLDSLASMKQGGTRGPSIHAGKPQQSLFLKAIEYDDTDLQMPPAGRLTDDEIAVFGEWIDDGAVVPDHMLGVPQEKSEQQKVAGGHWAYTLPKRSDQTIDQILREGLETRGLEMSPRANRRTLIQRLKYDLVGLPATQSEITAFEQDTRPHAEAYGELLENWLASPHFGERWARYWMDVARYADNKGYVFQEHREYPAAYQYRDWLIGAFNQDLPYDEFVTKQLAADLVAVDGDEAATIGDLPALGFLTLGRRFLNNKLDIIDDRLDVVSRGLMGLTLGCARCHDHKYDPLSQADYYAMAGVFLNTDEPGGEPWPHRLIDSKDQRQAYILIRGSARNIGAKVERRFVSFLDPQAQPFGPGSGRDELAAKITSPDNPLTARVYANRVWMRMTGASLVESPSDLGTRCPPPVQLKLLDHLATSLAENGWSTKQLIRMVALSDAYQQQSLNREDGAEADPQNELYWRMNRRRLDFEAFRDTLLARANLLDSALHGPAEKIDTDDLMQRRAIYAYIDRQNLPSVFRTFDFASPDTHNSARPQTSVPQQGLFVLNSDFMAQVSLQLSQVSAKAVGTGDSSARIQWLFNEVLGRGADAQEFELAQDFIEREDSQAAPNRDIRWLCGFGAFEPETGRLTGFQPLPTYSDGRWQGGTELPDEQLGWCMLHAEGGHAGNDLGHAAVRRWVAPRDGTVRVSGKLKHENKEGDGVRGSVLVDNSQAGQWVVKNSAASTHLPEAQVRQGQTIDFVVDRIASHNHDSFGWTQRISYIDSKREVFSSRQEHPEPVPEPLGRWAQLAQALLATNELAYVD